MSWAWEQDYLEKLPRFPKPKPRRDVAGRHYLTKADLNALYFATYELPRPRGWSQPFTVGRYWRAALVVFFNYGVDTGTVFKTAAFHGPILWRHVSWQPASPNGQGDVEAWDNAQFHVPTIDQLDFDVVVASTQPLQRMHSVFQIDRCGTVDPASGRRCVHRRPPCIANNRCPCRPWWV